MQTAPVASHALDSHESSGEASLELASRRTGLAFQRTRMAAERTLMASLRTSLALISFGFGLVQFVRSVHGSGLLRPDVSLNAARNFGISLLVLGIVLTILGISFHVRFMRQLRSERRAFIEERILPGRFSFPASVTLLAAAALLALGLLAAIGLVLKAGPFGRG